MIHGVRASQRPKSKINPHVVSLIFTANEYLIQAGISQYFDSTATYRKQPSTTPIFPILAPPPSLPSLRQHTPFPRNKAENKSCRNTETREGRSEEGG